MGPGPRINVVAMLFQAVFQNAEAGPLPYMHASTLTFTPILVRLNPSLVSLFCTPLVITVAAVQLFADLLTRCRGRQGAILS